MVVVDDFNMRHMCIKTKIMNTVVLASRYSCTTTTNEYSPDQACTVAVSGASEIGLELCTYTVHK